MVLTFVLSQCFIVKYCQSIILISHSFYFLSHKSNPLWDLTDFNWRIETCTQSCNIPLDFAAYFPHKNTFLMQLKSYITGTAAMIWHFSLIMCIMWTPFYCKPPIFICRISHIFSITLWLLWWSRNFSGRPSFKWTPPSLAY